LHKADNHPAADDMSIGATDGLKGDTRGRTTHNNADARTHPTSKSAPTRGSRKRPDSSRVQEINVRGERLLT
jgi:hypothetical protein